MVFVKFKNFLSNGGYATWVQTAVAVAAVTVAYFTFRQTDEIEGKKTTIELARRYYSTEPAPAMALLRLENAWLDVQAKAAASIVAYDPNTDPDNEKRFQEARPKMKERIDGDPTLQADFERMREVYYEVSTCIDTKICDQEFAGKLFGHIILRFYNATCPYIEEISPQLQHVHDNDKMLDFLKNVVGVTNKALYTCRKYL